MGSCLQVVFSSKSRGKDILFLQLVCLASIPFFEIPQTTKGVKEF
jgi:hypothetical protein